MAKRKKKPATEMNDKELEERIFPKKVLEELRHLAHEGEEEEEAKPSESS